MTALALLECMLRGEPDCQIAPGSASEIVELAIGHGVDALLWDALHSSDDGAMEIRRRLDSRVRAAVTRDLILQRELCQLIDALQAAGAHALIFKGTALAYTAYAHPWQRPRTDTDLLVPHGDFPAAERALAAKGYARSHAISTGTVVSHQIAFERTDPAGLHQVVDLHWKIVNPQVLADALTAEELWQRRRPAPALGAAAGVPSAVDSLVIAAIHRLAHHQGHDRLIWLFDLRVLAEAFSNAEWQALVTLAVERGVGGLCLDALRQTRDRLGAPLPREVEEQLGRAAPAETSRRYLEGPVHKRDVLGSDLRALTSWRDRWRLVREHAFPPAAFIRERYGVRNPLLLPALYVHRLVVGAVKWVR